ncbi:MAG: hypothetical protein C5B54_01565 [Acidobacteria bacterium]|nr:MAG: hypothetical protein C5B54_01565 [Acidobacteriota bacterium]
MSAKDRARAAGLAACSSSSAGWIGAEMQDAPSRSRRAFRRGWRMLELETVEYRLPEGRKLHCWLNRPASRVPPAAVAILVPGFGRRMHQHSALCRYLAANGIGVVRFDSLDHIGLSDGEISDYTLSGGLRSLEAAVAVARDVFPAASYSLVATSLTSRIALRYFQRDRTMGRLIAMSGIVNVRKTLAHVLAEDYSTWVESDLPEKAIFESQSIKMLPLYRDGHGHDWFTLGTTLREIAALSAPAHWFVGRDDDWIDRQDIEACAAAHPEQFLLTWLNSCGHDIGRNASAARAMMRRIVLLCLNDPRFGEDDIIEPGYNDLLQIALKERRIQRGSGSMMNSRVEVEPAS